MSLRQILFSTVAAFAITGMGIALPAPAGAQQAAVAIDNDDIGGVVRGPNGPEAGVWVIAETTDLPPPYAKIGQQLNLTAVPASDERSAAHYYPAIYWYAMMKFPPAQDFGGGSDIPKEITRETWRQRMGNVDCIGCHQLGQESTRTIPAQFGEFKTGGEPWRRGGRAGPGHPGDFMTPRLAGQRGGCPLKFFGDGTDRTAKGELPKAKPQRPQGV